MHTGKCSTDEPHASPLRKFNKACLPAAGAIQSFFFWGVSVFWKDSLVEHIDSG